MEASRGDQEPRSWTLRVLAPLALVATAAVLIAIVVGSLSDSGSGGKSSSSGSSTQAGKGCAAGNPPADAAIEAGYYLIKAGENLGTVTERTCIQAPRLEQLNPNLDPFQLQVGQCVNLEPGGCKQAGTG